MVILFLDFDGVLHPESPNSRTQGDYLFCRLPLLEAWLRERPGVDVVISSSWRQSYPMHEIISYFADDLQARILGCTPVLGDAVVEEFGGALPPLRFERESEVLQWLTTSTAPWRPWSALDDQAHLFRPFNPRLVVCDQAVGLTTSELVLLDAVLGITR